MQIYLNSISHDRLIDLFNRVFLAGFNTCLKSGFDEPLYTPSIRNHAAEVCFRADYVSSALHEIAHWCIAGKSRRELVDYGYWYEPDGRNSLQQKEFEKVEVKPQALEWIFSIAAGVKFHISADNLDVDSSSSEFVNSVIEQATLYIEQGLPNRAEMFYQTLSQNKSFGRVVTLGDFCLESLYSEL